MGCLFGWLGSAVLAESPPALLPTPNLLARGGVGRDSLGAVWVMLSSRQHVDVLPTPS